MGTESKAMNGRRRKEKKGEREAKGIERREGDKEEKVCPMVIFKSRPMW